MFKLNQKGLNLLGKKIDQKIKLVANDMLGGAQKIVPVDTGALKRSLRLVDAPNKDTICKKKYLIGSDLNYSVFVELGTVKMKAQPYLKPQIDNLPLYLRKRRKK